MNKSQQFIDVLKQSLRYCGVDLNELESYYNEPNNWDFSTSLDGLNLPIKEGAKVGLALFASDSFFPYLNKTIRLFLDSRQYLFLAEIISMAISTISYCDVKYVSFQKTMYSAQERQFDRFVEMLRTCEIEPKQFLPMFICCLQPTSQAQLYKWIDPAMEYLVRYAKNNYDEIAAILQNDLSLSFGYEVLFKVDRNRTVNLIYALIKQKGAKKSVLKPLLKPYIKYLFETLTQDLSAPLAQSRQNAVSILLMFKNEPNIYQLLKNIFDSETSKTIRNKLIKELNIEEPEPSLTTIAEIEEFCGTIDAKNSLPHNLSVYYTSGRRVNRNVLNVLYALCCKGGNSVVYAKRISSFIDQNDLQKLAAQLLEEIDSTSKTKSRVGAYCFTLLFGDDATTQSILPSINEFLQKKNAFTVKIVAALGASNQSGQRYLFELNKDTKIIKLYQKELSKALNISAKISQCNIEDIVDKSGIIIDLDGVTITDNLEVICEDGKKADFVANEINKQTQRFFDAFLSFRTFSPDSFLQNIETNVLYERIASTLFWGKYDKNKRLTKVFIVHDRLVRDLDNNAISLNDNDIIALVHPSELDYKYDFLKKLNVFQAFEQINRKAFLPSQQESMENRVSYFYMNVIDLDTLQKRAQKLGFKLLRDGDGNCCACYIAKFGYIARLDFVLNQNAVNATMLKIYEPEDYGKKDPEFKNSTSIARLSPRIFSEFVLAFEGLLK